jgi:hypothetical protein
MRAVQDELGGWNWYPKNWNELAEAEGYYVWDQEFLGSDADYKRYERYYELLVEMFPPKTFFLESGASRMFIVFDSACDAITFRFELAARGLT